MKKGISVILAVLLAVSCLTGLSGCGSSKKTTLYVYNWGQYISEGDDGSLDVIAAFEEAYPNIRVQYSTYDSNEIMYSKLSNGGITVDVIIPSDYMIGRMVQEGMLEELNFSNIPNYQYIDDSFKNTSYDPENKYSVPYTWGTVGIIYNTKYVDEADVTGWELLWNEKYAGKILMFDNSRDAFGIAEYLLGYDVNSTDEAELQACAAKLAEQKPVVQQYVMDQIFDAMENEEAWIRPLLRRRLSDHGGREPRSGFLPSHDPGLQHVHRRHVHPHLMPGEGGGGSLHQLPVQPGDFLRQHGVFGLQRPFHRGEGADGSGGRGQQGRLPRRGHPHHRHQLQLPAGGNLPVYGKPVHGSPQRLMGF